MNRDRAEEIALKHGLAAFHPGPVRASKSTIDAIMEAVAEVQAWLPIDEKAPRDGCTVLLGFRNELGRWRTVRGQWFAEGELDEWNDGDSESPAGWYEVAETPDDPPNCWQISPTNWQHLPPPPDGFIVQLVFNQSTGRAERG